MQNVTKIALDERHTIHLGEMENATGQQDGARIHCIRYRKRTASGAAMIFAPEGDLRLALPEPLALQLKEYGSANPHCINQRIMHLIA